MPRQYIMTWEPANKRWRKMYRGKLYTISTKELGTPPSKIDSWQQANEWWAQKLASMAPAPSVADHVAAILAAKPVEVLQAIANRGRAAEAAVATLQGISKINGRTITAEDLTSGRAVVPALYHYPVTAETLPAITQAVPIDPVKSVAHHVEQWQALQLASSKSLGRRKMNCHMLGYFARFMADAEVGELNEARWQQFFQFLSKQKLADNYRARILATAKGFVKYLYEARLIDLPRNLNSAMLAFAKTLKQVRPVDTEAIKSFLREATGQTMLHSLLMLNCGMTARDVADLRDVEVDWQAGTITRRRSKTRKHEGCPEVCYPLWAGTFSLLKAHRSGGDVVLVTKSGKPWIQEALDDAGNYKHSDSVGSNFKWTNRKAGTSISPKQLRQAGASKLAEHPQYKFYAQYYLSQSPKTVADKHYVQPSAAEFGKALMWLEKEFAY